MALSRLEQETIINYNQEENDAFCYTHDKSLMRRLDKLIENGEAITVVREGEGWREYKFPRKCVKVRFPRKMPDEKRAELAERMKALRKDS